MPKSASIFAAAFLALFLSACGSTPFLEAVDLNKSSYSADAKQRFIVSMPDVSRPGDSMPGDSMSSDRRRIICAEPSPDALTAISQAFAASAEIAAKGGGGVSYSLNENAAAIGLRTATIQLLRDGLYRACEAYQNGAIDKFGYALILNQYDDLMLRMMAIEGITTMRPAAQVVVGTKGEAADAGKKEKKSDSKTKTKGEAIAGVFNRPTVNKFTKGEITALSGPLEKLSSISDEINGSTLAGACLMWFTSGGYDKKKEGHQIVKRFCDSLLARINKRMEDLAAAK